MPRNVGGIPSKMLINRSTKVPQRPTRIEVGVKVVRSSGGREGRVGGDAGTAEGSQVKGRF